MVLRERTLPNKINELYILPILFFLVNVTLVLWFYLLHEYSQSNAVFETKYHFDQLAMANYSHELKLQIILYGAVLLITPLYLKFKKRWLLVALTLMHVGVLYDFFYLN